MTNLAYFQLAEGQLGADDTLLYFRADPQWVGAKVAS